MAQESQNAASDGVFREMVERSARSVLGELGVEGLLAGVVREAAALVHADHAFINIADEQAETMTVRYGIGDLRPYNGQVFARGEGLTGLVWRTGRGAFINDYASWDGRLDAAVASGVTAMLAVPLRRDQSFLGALALVHKNAERAFSENDLQVLSSFADLASIALVNARLHTALERSRQRYRSVVQDQTEMISRFLPDGTLTFVNDACARAFGTTPEAMVGRPIYQYIPPDEHERTRRELADLTPAAPFRDNELRQRMPDGSVAWHQWRDRGLFDADGRLIEIQTVGRDITEQKDAEQQLARSEARYRTLFAATPSGLLVEDADGVIVEVNDEVCRMLRHDRAALIGRHVGSLTTSSDEFVDGNIRRVLSGETLRHEVTNRDSSGSERILELLETRIDLPGGEPGILVVSQDVTERRQATEALHQSERRARRLARRTENLLSELDHRVKNNLVGLMALVSMYAASKSSARELADALVGKLHAMRAAHDRLSRDHWRSADLASLVSQLIGIAPEESIRARVAIAGPRVEVPAPQAGPLAMVFQELITNACKHGALASAEGTVALSWRIEPNGRLVIDWIESLPAAAGPVRRGRGQGLSLIEGLVKSDLQGASRFAFEPTGLRCRIESPLGVGPTPADPS